MAASSLNLTSLDFDTLKNNLKTYMQSQSVFKDYNFDDSNLSVLLSVLSYNSYLNSFYLNMVASESFLDTAQILDSVVSHAKALNYTPSSFQSPEAFVDVTFSTTGVTSPFIIPKGTQFSGSNSNGVFTFVTDTTRSVTSGNGTFVAYNIPIYEGSYINESFVIDNTVENQRFILSNPNVDTGSIQVTVYENNNTTGIDYIPATNLFGVTSNSAVYFIQAYKNQYEIVFGDGVFGRVPQNNATILVTYRITQGTSGGGVSSFVLAKDLGTYNGGQATTIVAVTSAASAGANSESIESIRFRAPRAFQTQDRAITTSDYKTLILDQFNDIKTLSAYGGETVDSSGLYYGKIIISPLTYAGTVLSDSRKKDVITFISNKMSVGLTPIIVDPDFLYISPDITVTYDPTRTNSTSSVIQNAVINAVNVFNSTYLEDFNITFYHSAFVDYISAVDPGIVSVNVTQYIQKIVKTTLNKSTSLSVNFNNALIPTTISSEGAFLLTDGNTYKLVDYIPNSTSLNVDANGNFVSNDPNKSLYLQSQNLLVQQYTKTGFVDYTGGIVNINNISVADYTNGSQGIYLYGEPVNNDVVASTNQILEFDINTVKVNVKTI